MITNILQKFLKDKDLKELIKGSGSAFLIRLIGILFSYIFTYIVTKNLGAKAWGIFTLSIIVLQLASLISRLGFDMALLKFTAEYSAIKEFSLLKKVYLKIIKLTAPFSLLISFLIYLSSNLIATRIFHKPYLAPYFKIISLAILPFSLQLIHSQGIRGFKKIKEFMLFQQSGISILNVLFFLIGFIFIKSFSLPVLSQCLSILVLTILSSAYWLTKLNKHIKEEKTKKNGETLAEKASSPYLLSIAIPMMLSSSLLFIMGWTDTFMLGIFKTETEVGIYNVALKISLSASIFLTAINTIAAPKFAEFWGKKDLKGLTKVARQSTKMIFYSSLPILIILLAFPEFILGLFGNEFKAGASALIFLTIAQFINAFTGSVGYILQMTGYQKYYQNVIFLGTIINIVLNYILIPVWGIAGAAIASATGMFFWNLLFTLKVKKILNNYIFYLPFRRG